jgi:Fructose-bisphosphate aldolase class-I
MTSLTGTAADLVRSGKGILAADESVSTMNTRLAAAGVPGTAEHRLAYRVVILAGYADRMEAPAAAANTNPSVTPASPAPVPGQPRIFPSLLVLTRPSGSFQKGRN